MKLFALVVSLAIHSSLATLDAHEGSTRLLIAQSCHPSYQGECVPITSDADCASGSGNGPAYVRGPVRVVGPDEYGLDRDGDGVGCEN
jgi:hypothetical protein